MPSRRDLIRMSDAEVKEFLRSSRTMMINSNGPGGYPHPMPMWYAVDDDGTVRMTTFRKSQKVANLRRDPRVSLLVEDGGGDYGQLRGVVIYGRAEVVDDFETTMETMRRVSGVGPLEGEARKAADAAMGKTAAKRVVLLIRPERIVSWDHRKLGGGY